jgi:hypothetical protein
MADVKVPIQGADNVLFVTRRPDMSDADWLKQLIKIAKVLRDLSNSGTGKALGGGSGTNVAELHVSVSRDGNTGTDVAAFAVPADDVDEVFGELQKGGVHVQNALGGVPLGVSAALEQVVKDVQRSSDAAAGSAARSGAESGVGSGAETGAGPPTDLRALTHAVLDLAPDDSKDVPAELTAFVDDALQTELDMQVKEVEADAARFVVFTNTTEFKSLTNNEEGAEAILEKVQTTQDAVNDRLKKELNPDTMIPKDKLTMLRKKSGAHTLDLAELDAALVTVGTLLETAKGMCPPCRDADNREPRLASDSGVRTQEWDSDGTGECMLESHPVIAPISSAQQTAQSLQDACASFQKFLWLLKDGHLGFGELAHTLLVELLDHLNELDKVIEQQQVAIADQVKAVNDVVTQNRVYNIPTDQDLSNFIAKTSETCGKKRVSAVKRPLDDQVCLVVMDGTLEISLPGTIETKASFHDVWAAAHENQASLTRYREAHALYRAAELLGRTRQMRAIREKIIALQVAETTGTLTTSVQSLQERIKALGRPSADSVGNFTKQGFQQCLEWAQGLLNSESAYVTEQLADHQNALNELTQKVQHQWNIAMTDKKSNTPGACSRPDAYTNVLSQLRATASKPVARYGDETARNAVVDAVKLLASAQDDLKDAKTDTEAFDSWLNDTLCKPKASDKVLQLALPFMAGVASNNINTIVEQANRALQSYEGATQQFNKATELYLLFNRPANAADTITLANALTRLTGVKSVAIDVDNDAVSMLFKFTTSTAAQEARQIGAAYVADLAACQRLSTLMPKFDETRAAAHIPVQRALAALVQPTLFGTLYALDNFLDRQTFGLDVVANAGDSVPGNELTQAPHNNNAPVVQPNSAAAENLANYVHEEFTNHWTTVEATREFVLKYVDADLKEKQSLLKNRTQGVPLDQHEWKGLTSNANLRSAIKILTHLRVLLKESPQPELKPHVISAIAQGVPLYALLMWVDTCAEEQRRQLIKLRTLIDARKNYTIRDVFNYMQQAFIPSVAAYLFECSKTSKSEKFDAEYASVDAEIKRRKDIAGEVRTALRAPMGNDKELTTQVWREFWIEPKEAVEAWKTLHATPMRDPPKFFKDALGDDIENGTYSNLVTALQGAPDALYLYALRLAREYPAAKGGAKTDEWLQGAAGIRAGACAVRGGAKAGTQGAEQGAQGTRQSAQFANQGAQIANQGAQGARLDAQVTKPNAQSAKQGAEGAKQGAQGAKQGEDKSTDSQGEEQEEEEDEDEEEEEDEMSPVNTGASAVRNQRPASSAQQVRAPSPRPVRPAPQPVRRMARSPRARDEACRALESAVRRCAAALFLEFPRLGAADCVQGILQGRLARQTRKPDARLLKEHAEEDPAELARLVVHVCAMLGRR